MANVPVEFILFAVILIGIAIFNRHTLAGGLVGLATITNFIGVAVWVAIVATSWLRRSD